MRCATCGRSAPLRPVITFPTPELGSFASLTTAEYVIACHLASGASNHEIADRLGITEKTVKSHITAVIGKLMATGRTQVAVAVVRQGLVEWE